MSAAFLSSASSTMRRARSSAGISGAGALAAASRGALGQAASGFGGSGHGRAVLRRWLVGLLIQAGGRRCTPRRPRERGSGSIDPAATRGADRGRRQAEPRALEVVDAVLPARERRRRATPGRAQGSPRAARPPPGAASNSRSGSCQVGSSRERLGREDHGERRLGIAPPAPRRCRRCTTGPAGRPRSGSARRPGCRRSRARPSRRGARPGVTAPAGLCGGCAGGHEQDAIEARAPRAPPRRSRGGRRGSGRTCRP